MLCHDIRFLARFGGVLLKRGVIAWGQSSGSAFCKLRWRKEGEVMLIALIIEDGNSEFAGACPAHSCSLRIWRDFLGYQVGCAFMRA